jgi:hypothetical protein
MGGQVGFTDLPFAYGGLVVSRHSNAFNAYSCVTFSAELRRSDAILPMKGARTFNANTMLVFIA